MTNYVCYVCMSFILILMFVGLLITSSMYVLGYLLFIVFNVRRHYTAFIFVTISWKTSTHIKNLKYTSYLYLTTRMMSLLSTLHNLTCANRVRTLKYLRADSVFALFIFIFFFFVYVSFLLLL